MAQTQHDLPLAGTVTLVAGATRGAGRGIAVELGAAGATVWCTGRSTAGHRSDYDRPETIEETAALVDEAGGHGVVAVVDHLDPDQVAGLARRVDEAHGRLDLLVNDIGASPYLTFDLPLWQQDLQQGLTMLRVGAESHLITSHFLLPLVIRRPGGLVVEVGDGTESYNATRYRASAFYDVTKDLVNRLAFVQGHELAPHGCAAVAVTPGWLRSEMMLDIYQVTEATWRDATGPRDVDAPHDAGFATTETPRFVGRAVAALAADPARTRWNQRSVTVGELAREYGFTDVDGSTPDAWRYNLDAEADPSVDPDDYR